MNRITIYSAVFVLLTSAAPVMAENSVGWTGLSRTEDNGELPAYLQCVPYARQVTGVRIYGDAHSWWGQAKGRYKRGSRPKVGAVLALKPHGNMRLGHVAAVSRIVDSRTVLLRHANWSPINGRRGQIEDNVKAVDVSQQNDWSRVRIWYAPIDNLGGTHWPVQGFIYGERVSEWTAKPAQIKQTPSRQPHPDPIGAIIAANLH